MGYDRSLYVGPFIECTPKKKTKTIFGCPECKCEVARPKQTDQKLLFADPVTHKSKKHKDKGSEVECCEFTVDIPREQAYAEMNKFENEHPEFEDRFAVLQRHAGAVDIWLAPNESKGAPREFSYEINEDPMFEISNFTPASEKAWMEKRYQKEIEILSTFFESCKMGWGVVIDGC